MSVKNKRKVEKNSISVISKGIAAGLFTAVVLMFVFALLIEKSKFDINRMTIVMVLIYFLSAFTAGIVISIHQYKGALFNSITVSMIMVIIHLIYSLIAGGGKLNSYMILIVISSAVLGGIAGNKIAEMIKKQRRRY